MNKGLCVCVCVCVGERERQTEDTMNMCLGDKTERKDSKSAHPKLDQKNTFPSQPSDIHSSRQVTSLNLLFSANLCQFPDKM